MENDHYIGVPQEKLPNRLKFKVEEATSLAEKTWGLVINCIKTDTSAEDQRLFLRGNVTMAWRWSEKWPFGQYENVFVFTKTGVFQRSFHREGQESFLVAVNGNGAKEDRLCIAEILGFDARSGLLRLPLSMWDKAHLRIMPPFKKDDVFLVVSPTEYNADESIFG